MSTITKWRGGGFPTSTEGIAFLLGKGPSFFIYIGSPLGGDNFLYQRDTAFHQVRSIFHDAYFLRFLRFCHVALLSLVI